MKYEIRLMTKYDFEKAKDLVCTCFKKDKTESNYFDYENYFDLIAISENNIVGNVLVQRGRDSFSGETWYYVNDVCVKESARNNGIATALLKEMENMAKEEEITNIRMTSNSTRKVAHHLYEKLGYKKIDTNMFIKNI